CMYAANKDVKLAADLRRAEAKEYAERARLILVEGVRRGAPGIPGVLEAETLPIIDSQKCNPYPQNMASYGWRNWSNSYQLFCPAELGGHVTLELAVAHRGPDRLDIHFARSDHFGKIDVSLDGNKAGETFDAYATKVAPSGPIPFGVLELSEGKHQIRFTLV